MRFWPIRINLFPLLLVHALLSPTSLHAAPPASIQEAIDLATSPSKSPEARVAAAKSVTDGWQDTLPILIQNIDTYYQAGEGRPYSEDAVKKLVPLTDLLVTIVVDKDGALQRFREIDTAKTIDLLAWAAADDDRSLRFNASYILVQAVEDDNLCIILHRLREPNLGYSGQVNLLQVAISGMSAATRDNVEAAQETAEKLKGITEGKTAVFRDLLAEIARERVDDAGPTPEGDYCARYDVDTGIVAPVEPPSAPSP